MEDELRKLTIEINDFAELTKEGGPLAFLIAALRKAELNDEAKALTDKCEQKWLTFKGRAKAIAEKL